MTFLFHKCEGTFGASEYRRGPGRAVEAGVGLESGLCFPW